MLVLNRCLHLDDVLYFLLGQDISSRVAWVDDGDTSDLGAISAGGREGAAQIVHLVSWLV